MAAGTTLKLGLKQGGRSTFAGASSIRSHAAVGNSSMAFDLKTQSSLANVAEAVPSPFGIALDRSQGAPQKSPAAPGGIHRRRRSTKGTMPAIIKRSTSTPNVRGLASTDTAGMSLADKRRNKLGYHRTSVACGHCRRRKIRCLLASDDLHGRCSNCIRLKKECNFFPVDQQPQLDRRPRSGSKNDMMSMEASTSSSSSPALAGGHVVEQVESFNHYRPMAVTTGPDFAASTEPLSASRISPLGKAPSHQRGFEFSQPPDRPSRWNPSYLDQSPASAGPGHPTPDDPSSAYWRFAESPVTPAFSHFSGHSGSNLHFSRDHGGSFSLAGSREDLGWPLPARSMSFGQVEDLSMNYQNHYHQPFHHDLRRRISTDLYAPPSLDTSNSSTASISEPHSAPVSAPAGSQPRQQFGFPPAWNTLSGHPIGGIAGKGPDGFGGWYSEPSPLAKVQEEDPGPALRGGPPVFYSGAGHHAG